MTAPNQQQMPQIEYKVDEATGQITRTDKDSTLVIGKYIAESKTVEFVSRDVLKFRSPTIRFLNDSGIKFEVLTIAGEATDKPADESIPPCPKMTIEAGDKTPAVVEWFKRYRPAEYAVRYGVRGPGEITKLTGYETNPRTGEKIPQYQTVPAIIADRKTHLTEKPEANDAGQEIGI